MEDVNADQRQLITPRIVPIKSVDSVESTAHGVPSSKDDTDNYQVPSVEIEGAPDVSDAGKVIIPELRVLGEFKDKKGLEQMTDPHLGPDIRYALTSQNADFLRRIKWGPLTLGEFREVTYRLREIESQKMSSNNILKGRIIDLEL